MEKPVADQFRALKDRIQKFRDMLNSNDINTDTFVRTPQNSPAFYRSDLTYSRTSPFTQRIFQKYNDLSSSKNKGYPNAKKIGYLNYEDVDSSSEDDDDYDLKTRASILKAKNESIKNSFKDRRNNYSSLYGRRNFRDAYSKDISRQNSRFHSPLQAKKQIVNEYVTDRKTPLLFSKTERRCKSVTRRTLSSDSDDDIHLTSRKRNKKLITVSSSDDNSEMDDSSSEEEVLLVNKKPLKGFTVSNSSSDDDVEYKVFVPKSRKSPLGSKNRSIVRSASKRVSKIDIDDISSDNYSEGGNETVQQLFNKAKETSDKYARELSAIESGRKAFKPIYSEVEPPKSKPVDSHRKVPINVGNNFSELINKVMAYNDSISGEYDEGHELLNNLASSSEDNEEAELLRRYDSHKRDTKTSNNKDNVTLSGSDELDSEAINALLQNETDSEIIEHFSPAHNATEKVSDDLAKSLKDVEEPHDISVFSSEEYEFKPQMSSSKLNNSRESKLLIDINKLLNDVNVDDLSSVPTEDMDISSLNVSNVKPESLESL